MELVALKKYEGKRVKLILRNNYSYTDVIFKINSEDLLEFEDSGEDLIELEPAFVMMIKCLNGDKNEN